jgi:hypothetical protein
MFDGRANERRSCSRIAPARFLADLNAISHISPLSSDRNPCINRQ